jgi:hypothetical protein
MAKYRVIVFPPSNTGGRRVKVDGDMPVRAYSLQDLSVFLERAGIEDWTEVNQMAEDLVEAASDLIEWCGGEPEAWGS